MTVQELIDILVECEKDLVIINERYQDLELVRQERVFNFRNGEKSSTKHLRLEFLND